MIMYASYVWVLVLLTKRSRNSASCSIAAYLKLILYPSSAVLSKKCISLFEDINCIFSSAISVCYSAEPITSSECATSILGVVLLALRVAAV